MADSENKKSGAANKNKNKPVQATQTVSNIVGSEAKPAVLSSTTKLDIDTNKVLIDNIIYTGLNGGLDTAAIENFTTISNSRDQVYQLIDSMAKDATVSSIIRTYSEDVCETDDNGHIIWCESPNPNISKFVNYLLNVMNVDKNLYKWVYCLLKYGDVYLRMYRESDYDDRLFNKEHINRADYTRTLNEDKTNENINLNVHTPSDPYSFYIEMVPDPSTMFELTKYGKTFGYIEVPNMNMNNFDTSESFMGGTNTAIFNYKLKSSDINIYQADDFIHASLEDNSTRFPETVQIFTSDADYKQNDNALTYNVKRGKSLLYDSYKTWREKALLENAALLNRITRSSILRKVSVEVGDMPKEQVQSTLRRIKEMMEQKTSINVGDSMTEYNNPGPIENNIYFATHNGQGAISVESIGGDVNVKDLADLDWWNNKFYSSYGIPKQYFGWTDDGAGFNGGTSLTILSSVYAKGVKRVQNTMLQTITDGINLILVNKGLKSYLNNFVLKMRTPITQEELDYRANLTDRISALSNFQSLLSDIENKSRRLSILKSLVSSLHYNDEIVDQIQKEINAEAEKEKEALDLAQQTNSEDEPPEVLDKKNEADELDLTPMPDSGLTTEAFEQSSSGSSLTEEQDFNVVTESDELPTPEELNKTIDFTENS